MHIPELNILNLGSIKPGFYCWSFFIYLFIYLLLFLAPTVAFTADVHTEIKKYAGCWCVNSVLRCRLYRWLCTCITQRVPVCRKSTTLTWSIKNIYLKRLKALCARQLSWHPPRIIRIVKKFMLYKSSPVTICVYIWLQNDCKRSLGLVLCLYIQLNFFSPIFIHFADNENEFDLIIQPMQTAPTC